MKLKLSWAGMAKSAHKKVQTHYCKKLNYKANFKCFDLCLRLRNLQCWPEISNHYTSILFTLKNYITQ